MLTCSLGGRTPADALPNLEGGTAEANRDADKQRDKQARLLARVFPRPSFLSGLLSYTSIMFKFLFGARKAPKDSAAARSGSLRDQAPGDNLQGQNFKSTAAPTASPMGPFQGSGPPSQNPAIASTGIALEGTILQAHTESGVAGNHASSHAPPPVQEYRNVPMQNGHNGGFSNGGLRSVKTNELL